MAPARLTARRARPAAPAAFCRLPHKQAHMATNPAIDPDLLDSAVEVSGERTEKAAVTLARRKFIAQRSA
jgi:hypothetical protein